jgi:hypothetical protein
MKPTKAKIIVHPFFLAAYPVLFLLSYNITEIPVTQAVRPLLITLFVALVLTFLFGRLTKNYGQGALSASLVLLLFFSYGHIYNFLEINAPVLANHAVLGPVWLVLLALGMLLKWKLRNLAEATNILNICTAALLALPVLQIGWFMVQSGGVSVKQESSLDNLSTTATTSLHPNLPDVYYIIVDAYTGADILQELYQYDNSEFIHYLESRGFYVAEDSRSNYIQTPLSLSSSLNMKYINYLNASLGDNYQSRAPLAEMIQHSALRNFLEEKGYKTIAFANAHGYLPTIVSDADIFIDYKPRITNNLEGLLLTSSAVRVFGDQLEESSFGLYDCREYQRGGILNVLDNLKKIPELPGQKFVFAHIFSPHPPFIFGADGQPVEIGPCSPNDNNTTNLNDYRTGYPQQVAFLNHMLQNVVEQILSKSAVPPIIIIQGDHGSGMLLDWNSSTNTCLRERTSSLNAYYLPGEGKQDLYSSITPVNSFRIVLNNYFGANLPLLEDRIYYSSWDTPYKFEDVTDRIEARCNVSR